MRRSKLQLLVVSQYTLVPIMLCPKKVTSLEEHAEDETMRDAGTSQHTYHVRNDTYNRNALCIYQPGFTVISSAT